MFNFGMRTGKFDTLEKWVRRIAVAKKKDKPQRELRDESLRLYVGQHWDQTVMEPKNEIVINRIFSDIKSLLPSLYFRDPHIFVIPKNRESEKTYEMMEHGLNYYWRELKIKGQVTECVLDALIFERAIAKVGYMIETDFDETGNEYIKKEELFVQRISPNDILIDPEATNFANARWIAQRIVKPLEDLKKSKVYRNTADLKATQKLTPELIGEVESEDFDRVVMWQIWDKVENQWMTMAENHEHWLRKPADHPYGKMEGLPYLELVFHPIPDKLFGLMMPQVMKRQQQEINRIRTKMATYLERFGDKYVYDEQAVSEEDADKFAQADVGTALGLSNPGDRDLRRLFDLIQVPNMPSGDIIHLDRTEKDWRIVSGISEMKRSGREPGVKTLGEAELIEAGSNVRLSSQQDAVQEFCVDIARKLAQLMKQFFTKERMIRIVGDEDKVQWKKFTKRDIQGEYDYEIKTGAAAPINQFLEWQKANIAWQIFRGHPFIRQKELVSYVLDKLGLRTENLMKTDEELAKEASIAQKLQQFMGQEPGQAPIGARPPGGTMMGEPSPGSVIPGGMPGMSPGTRPMGAA